MKCICSVGLIVLMAACSSHPVKCHGSLRPINTTTSGAIEAVPPPGSEPSRGPRPARGSKPTQGALPAKGSKPVQTDPQS